jgi:uncharacterized membrane protein YgcG
MRYKLWVLLFALATPAFAKSLYWRALDVNANLDGDGRLHVVEKQRIVFDGDWNGGERTFNIRAGQSLRFGSISRIDETGEHELAQGDLSKVDHYQFTSPTALRWRSRLPEDPPFANKEIIYVLRYTLDGVLQFDGGTYTLNHDFAFPDRSGVIEQFSLHLDIDPVWRGATSPVAIARTNLAPGQNAVITLRLEFTGASAPASVVRTLSSKVIYGVLIMFALLFVYLLFDFYMAESGKGRFDRILAPGEIDNAFLEQNLFSVLPEVAGTAMDNKTAGPEVAAVLARMTQEGKLESSLEERGMLLKHKTLCLTLKKDVDELPSYEAKLVRALFFGAKNTDTDRIRKHYSGSGFNPAGLIETGVKQELQRIKGWEKKPVVANWKADWMFIVAGLVLLIVAGIMGSDNDAPVCITVGVGGFIVLGFAAIAAKANANIIRNYIRFLIPAIVLTPLYWFVIGYTRGAARLLLHAPTLIAICAFAAALTKLTLDLLRSPESPERIAFRKKMYAARDYFVAELNSKTPRLRDEWYPYFLAFGLGTHVDKWFGSHGAGVTEGSSEPRMAISSSSGSSSMSSGFTGGGGAFGGAGASGGWAIAAAAMAAGVSAPSSSGSSSGGSSSSSSSSSSGGGGGGGW